MIISLELLLDSYLIHDVQEVTEMILQILLANKLSQVGCHGDKLTSEIELEVMKGRGQTPDEVPEGGGFIGGRGALVWFGGNFRLVAALSFVLAISFLVAISSLVAIISLAATRFVVDTSRMSFPRHN